MSGEEGKMVAVTGASGYIASWLVKMLLERGYTVKASVRDPNDPKKTEHLLSLDGAKERLHLFQADLLEEGSFDAVIDGCEGVFHTASPVQLSASNPQVELLDPAVKGTLNVLRSCARVPSIKRVILTSSIASVAFNLELKNGVTVDESWFSDPSYCEEKKVILSAEESSTIWTSKLTGQDELRFHNGLAYQIILKIRIAGAIVILYLGSFYEIMKTEKCIEPRAYYNEQHAQEYFKYIFIQSNVLWYPLSKILAEDAAWKFTEQNGIDMVAINPGLVFGPLLQPSASLSVGVVLNVVNGAESYANASFRWVDVRDVALAHILAYEIPSASGRYCLVGRCAHLSEVINILRGLYPNLKLPDKSLDDGVFSQNNDFTVSTKKSKGLGINYTPLEMSLKDTVDSLKEKNLVSF